MAKYSTMMASEFSSDDEPDMNNEGKVKFLNLNLKSLGDLSAESLDINDDQLSELLTKYGIRHGPLVETTRKLYKRLLIREIKNDNGVRAGIFSTTQQQSRPNVGQQQSAGGLPQPITLSSVVSQSVTNSGGSNQQQLKRAPMVTNSSMKSMQGVIPGANKAFTAVGGTPHGKMSSNLITTTNRSADVYSSDEDDSNHPQSNLARQPLPTKGGRQLINLGKRPLDLSSAAKKRQIQISSPNDQSVDDEEDEDDEDDSELDELTDDDSDDDDSDEDSEDDSEEDDDEDEDEDEISEIDISDTVMLNTKGKASSAQLSAAGAIAASSTTNQASPSRRLGRKSLYAILAILAVIVAYFFVSILE